MDANTLINYIFENNKTEDILEKIGCHHISGRSPKEWRCALPKDDNPTKVSIKKNEFLSVNIYTNEEKVYGNIITLLMYIDKCKFITALKKIHDILNIPFKKITKKKDEIKTPVDIFKKNIGNKRNMIDFQEMLMDECILSGFEPYLHPTWYREGIIHKTRDKFNIGYDYERSRIVIPHRYWSGESNQYIGIIGRTVMENYEILNIPKYFPLKSYPKSNNLYGLNENYADIIKHGYVVVFEAEKSVLKRDSRNDPTGVALMGHDMSDEQVKILMGLNVEIIIALDNDIPVEHTWSICEKFYKSRKVSYIVDPYNFLKEKQSPADLHNKLYQWLFNHRKTFSESEMGELKLWREKHRQNWKKSNKDIMYTTCFRGVV